jgi:hypothetical protein
MPFVIAGSLARVVRDGGTTAVVWAIGWPTIGVPATIGVMVLLWVPGLWAVAVVLWCVVMAVIGGVVAQRADMLGGCALGAVGLAAGGAIAGLGLWPIEAAAASSGRIDPSTVGLGLVPMLAVGALILGLPFLMVGIAVGGVWRARPG